MSYAKLPVCELIERLANIDGQTVSSMKMENGATFGEFAALRALKAKGGEAPFSELAKIELRGIALILGRMLSPRSRQKGVSGRQTMNGDGERPALVRRHFVGSGRS
ncbi:hypothetical protein J4G43_027190 [Bradyrhizobium barranii subsp. barranii]|uniref:Uncharacterized protein n=1 Tax=Bradyrhizobium barranii subsp. barranii TaxID=2823807 RepID=A0A939S2T1_9BRAD|nr:hypothetical protein [Bradyrhizobium barranii]UEM08476.1 hypothetical protein J4G43_027190 [Bradyrhizobium barranii subsp. barranii]